MNWPALSATCGALMVMAALFTVFYSRLNTVRDRNSTAEDRSLNEKLDQHFGTQKDTLARVERNLENMGRILEGHMVILNDHSTRLAVAETKLGHLSEKLTHANQLE